MNSKTSILKVSKAQNTDSYYVKILGVRDVKGKNISKLIPKLRELSSLVKVQAIQSDIVFGLDHLMRVIEMTLELWNRGIRISRSIETDLLMRLCCTDQISKAIAVGGLKKWQPGCLILISRDLNSILEVEMSIRQNFAYPCMSVLRPGKKKMEILQMKYGFRTQKMDRKYFENSLVERAALVELI